MSILFLQVHYVARDGPSRGKCRNAEACDHGIESVDLCIAEDAEDFIWILDAEEFFKSVRPRDVKFDSEGKEGTFHFANDCPIVRREKERRDELQRWIERSERKRGRSFGD